MYSPYRDLYFPIDSLNRESATVERFVKVCGYMACGFELAIRIKDEFAGRRGWLQDMLQLLRTLPTPKRSGVDTTLPFCVYGDEEAHQMCTALGQVLHTLVCYVNLVIPDCNKAVNLKELGRDEARRYVIPAMLHRYEVPRLLKEGWDYRRIAHQLLFKHNGFQYGEGEMLDLTFFDDFESHFEYCSGAPTDCNHTGPSPEELSKFDYKYNVSRWNELMPVVSEIEKACNFEHPFDSHTIDLLEKVLLDRDSIGLWVVDGYYRDDLDYVLDRYECEVNRIASEKNPLQEFANEVRPNFKMFLTFWRLHYSVHGGYNDSDFQRYKEELDDRFRRQIKPLLLKLGSLLGHQPTVITPDVMQALHPALYPATPADEPAKTPAEEPAEAPETQFQPRILCERFRVAKDFSVIIDEAHPAKQYPDICNLLNVPAKVKEILKILFAAYGKKRSGGWVHSGGGDWGPHFGRKPYSLFKNQQIQVRRNPETNEHEWRIVPLAEFDFVSPMGKHSEQEKGSNAEK